MSVWTGDGVGSGEDDDEEAEALCPSRLTFTYWSRSKFASSSCALSCEEEAREGSSIPVSPRVLCPP